MSEDLNLSEELRRARETRGESLEQVHQRTAIGLNVLRGLEEGDLQVVESVYTRLAIAHYASHLGLDGDALVQRFDRETGSTGPPPVQVRTSPDPAPGLPPATPLADVLRSQPPGRLAAFGAAVLVILALVLYLLSSGDDDETSHRTPKLPPVSDSPASPKAPAVALAVVEAPVEPTDAEASNAAAVPEDRIPVPEPQATVDEETPAADAVQDTVVDEPVEVATPSRVVAMSPGSDAVDSSESAADSAIIGQIVLQADVIDTVWVRVQWDGVDGIGEEIPRGERRIWTANRFFMVVAGRPHNVRFRFQGQLLSEGRLGDPTKTLRFRASADGVQLLGPDLEPIAPIIAQVQPDTMESSQPGVR